MKAPTQYENLLSCQFAENQLAGMPGYGTALSTEEVARVIAYSHEEAEAFLRDSGDEHAELMTPGELASCMRHLFDEQSAA